MAGLYTHTTRAAGTVVTAVIYNGDHQNHITNDIPDKMEGWGSVANVFNASRADATTDPYTSQTTQTSWGSLDGDVERLRYMIKQVLDYLNGVNGSGSSASATTALGTAIGKWYFGIRNPALRAVGCRVTKTTAFSHTTSGTRQVVSYATGDFTEDWDQDGASTGFHEGATNPTRLTVPAGCGGKYLIGADATFASAAASARIEVLFRKNGATFLGGEILPINAWLANVKEIVPCVTASLAAADYVELVINQTIGSPSLVGGIENAGGPAFWIHLLGA